MRTSRIRALTGDAGVEARAVNVGVYDLDQRIRPPKV